RRNRVEGESADGGSVLAAIPKSQRPSAPVDLAAPRQVLLQQEAAPTPEVAARLQVASEGALYRRPTREPGQIREGEPVTDAGANDASAAPADREEVDFLLEAHQVGRGGHQFLELGIQDPRVADE